MAVEQDCGAWRGDQRRTRRDLQGVGRVDAVRKEAHGVHAVVPRGLEQVVQRVEADAADHAGAHLARGHTRSAQCLV